MQQHKRPRELLRRVCRRGVTEFLEEARVGSASVQTGDASNPAWRPVPTHQRARAGPAASFRVSVDGGYSLHLSPTIYCGGGYGPVCCVTLGRPASTYLASTPPLASVASLADTAICTASSRRSVRDAGSCLGSLSPMGSAPRSTVRPFDRLRAGRLLSAPLEAGRAGYPRHSHFLHRGSARYLHVDEEIGEDYLFVNTLPVSIPWGSGGPHMNYGSPAGQRAGQARNPNLEARNKSEFRRLQIPNEPSADALVCPERSRRIASLARTTFSAASHFDLAQHRRRQSVRNAG
jgi:hypothetical protein